jgi:hypothetical protein
MSRTTRSNPWASRIEYLEKENLRLKEENKCIQPLQEENQRLRILNVGIREGVLRFGASWNGETTDIKTIDTIHRLSPRATHYNINIDAIDQWTNGIPEMLWQQKILEPFFSLKELAMIRPTNANFEGCWQHVLSRGVIRVPQGCPTLEKAMDLAVIFSERNVFTEADPLKIQMDKGVHEIVGKYVSNIPIPFGRMNFRVNVTCSHITFVGKGKDQTMIRGGFKVENQQHVKFEELTITNQSGPRSGRAGLYLSGSETTVDVLKCAVKECGATGMHVRNGATVTASQCEFTGNGNCGVYCRHANTKARLNECTMHHNGGSGLSVYDRAVVDLHGTKTDIHSNKGAGIRASRRTKVNIHLPSQHNTSHDNVGEDRRQFDGGSIANINADGTFTHVYTTTVR